MKLTIHTTGKREAEEASYGQHPQGYEQPYSPPAGAGYPPPEGYYPPPAGAPGYVEGAEHYGQPAIDPAAQIHPDYNSYPQPGVGGYAPPDPNAYPATPANPYAAGGPRRADENVSPPQAFNNELPSSSVGRGGAAAAPMYNPEGVPFYYDPHSIPPFAVGDGGCLPLPAMPTITITSPSTPHDLPLTLHHLSLHPLIIIDEQV